MSFISEFKAFALKGNAIDLAIGVVIGAAFGKVVSSLVSDVIMPPLGVIIGGIDFSSLAIKMNIPGMTAEPVELKYGLFINAIVNFLIISLTIFLVIKVMNRFYRREKKEELATTKDCPECAMQIPLAAKRCGHCGSPLEGVKK